jgi:solute carrier family 25 2-oxodicarboxylate transporter 21
LLRGGDERRSLTDMETVAAAAGAGAISAIVYTPVDLITIQQQKLVLNPIETARNIVEKHGFAGLLRGFSSCAVREALYSAGYLGLAPIFTYYASSTSEFSSCSPHGTHSLAAGICGASLAGILVSTLTHPVDTCKTCVQSDMLGRTYPSAFQTSTILYSQGGVSALFKGLIPRVTRVCGAFFVCMTLRDMAIDYKTTNFYRYQRPEGI